MEWEEIRREFTLAARESFLAHGAGRSMGENCFTVEQRLCYEMLYTGIV